LLDDQTPGFDFGKIEDVIQDVQQVLRRADTRRMERLRHGPEICPPRTRSPRGFAGNAKPYQRAA
jgi:hypothetical protein